MAVESGCAALARNRIRVLRCRIDGCGSTHRHELLVQEATNMALKAPGILIFLLSIIIALAVFFTRFFGATIPFLSGDTTQFYGLLAAYAILVLGCIMRGL
jgi:hypothetical protein